MTGNWTNCPEPELQLLLHHQMILFSKYLYKCSSFTKTVNPVVPRGKLTIVPTPIGNMNDLSPNMLRALLSADLIGCEDRRVAGQLYQLIKSRNILDAMNEQFGSIGLTSLVEASQANAAEQESEHKFYNYSNMNDKQRRKFLNGMPEADQNQFKINYLKYRALKVLNREGQFRYEGQEDKLDELYGIELTDMKHIETQINNCRKNKGRGLLIPLNTYNETKMFDLVRFLLQTKKVVMVSDAGMPCISDPGWKLVDQIRTKMPSLPIEVIGGPSSVGIMILQSSICSNNGQLSGRFQGFSNLTTGNFEQNNFELKNVKMQQFSLNFINGKKLKKRLIYLQKAFSSDHKILVTNQLTKKYQRRYHGTISSLIERMNHDQFESIGQVSYLVYPGNAKGQEDKSSIQQCPAIDDIDNAQENIDVSNFTMSNISIKQFLKSLAKHNPSMPAKQICNILCAIFGIKQGQARRYVYDKFSK